MGVRWNAAGALKKIGTPEAIKATIPTLIQALQDQDADVRQDTDVRQEVVWALGWIGSGAKDAVSALIQALQDQGWVVRKNAAVVLKKIGTPEALKAVKEYQSQQ